MRRSIVEGEPGIFPPPVAQLLQRMGGWLRRRIETPPPEPRGGAGERDADPG